MFVEYIWIDGNNKLRSKTRIVPDNTVQFPEWDYDGSSTNQATTTNSEVILRPCSVYHDPFRVNGVLVLCSTYTSDGDPLANNHRDWANDLFNSAHEEEPWYGIEQEYFLMDTHTNMPIGFPADTQGQYYCSVGSKNAFGRQIAEKHMLDCIYAGLTISGINAEVAPGQWEYQIGPCVGIDAADQLWIARYILERITENCGVYVSLDPKPLQNWNGSGCHTNFSTKSMRSVNGLGEIYRAINKLNVLHKDHMNVYGDDNEKRLTGTHETARFDTFSYGIATRNTSIRINNKTRKDACGYFEDRRPSANMNPYLVTGKIFETVCIR